MIYTLDLATPGQITGRVVGDMREHVAVAVFTDATGKGGYLLAVRADGSQYATWAWGLNIAEDGVNVWWGNHFMTEHYASAYDAFTEAAANLAERVKYRS